MTGIQEYEDKNNKRINNLFVYNEDKPYLKGFYYYLKGTMSSSSIYTYMRHIIDFINRSGKQIQNLDMDDYLTYLGSMENVSSSYQICVYSALKRFSAYLYESEKNNKNPMEKIHRPKFKESQVTIEKRDKAYLTKRETAKIFRNVESGLGSKNGQNQWKVRDKAILMIFLNTGIRCSALYKLDIDSVNFSEHQIIVTDKGGKVNKFALSEETEQSIKQWLNYRAIYLGDIQETALFISNKKVRLSVAGIQKLVRKYGSNIQGKHITPHKLRATYGTQLYNATHDIKFVQDMMGHASPSTTQRYIRGTKKEELNRAKDIMSKFTNSD